MQIYCYNKRHEFEFLTHKNFDIAGRVCAVEDDEFCHYVRNGNAPLTFSALNHGSQLFQGVWTRAIFAWVFQS